jgi:uncharacterized protein with HEPN domain
MPQRDVALLLEDVIGACEVIEGCTAAMSDSDYATDVVIRSAVERQFEIIGEAIKRLIQAEAGLSLRIPEASEIIQFRNFLAHGYHLIDHGVVWAIVRRDVPQLRVKAETLLDERRPPRSS